MNRRPSTSIIIHGFALLHVAAAVLCRLAGISDDIILTSLTIFLTVILCLRYRQSVEFSAIVIIIANIVGYLMGNGIAAFVNLFISHPLLSPAIATFITTETMGWGLYFFMKQYSSRYSSEHKATSLEITWLVLAVVLILGVRIIIQLFSSRIFGGETLSSAVSSFADNSLILLAMVCVTIYFVGLDKRRISQMPQRWIIVSAFFIVVSSLAALFVAYGLPFHFNTVFSLSRYLGLLLIAAMAEALIYSVIYMIEYAISAKRNAEKERVRADLAKFQYLNLKQQVNPHFLFNSLNILDALVLDGKDEEASTYIHKLAGIYRYMLKNEDESTVTLRDEMNYVEMYRDLLKVRFQEGLDVEVAIPEEDMSKFVIPCSVQLLLENATKHNAVSPGKPLRVVIKSDGETLTVTNNLIPRLTPSQSSGLGLNYIREQYNERSDKGIEVIPSEDSYTVKLPLL